MGVQILRAPRPPRHPGPEPWSLDRTQILEVLGAGAKAIQEMLARISRPPSLRGYTAWRRSRSGTIWSSSKVKIGSAGWRWTGRNDTSYSPKRGIIGCGDSIHDPQ